MVTPPANKLPPSPKRREERKGKPRITMRMVGIEIITETETSIDIQMAKLTYALKLIFIPDLRRFTPMSLKKGKNRAILSPMT
ncbi:MAG: hypothetical protein NWE82_01430 [Candidatus Bathyarchaeota archaeon]|nr:hypothetical protein [Candidatus Bathyarchaeota archaeon]